ncbi:MAG TPA: hypothetical protein VHE78_18145 [Gemmatimonadaceae bacterium]|nr:hypothetical protein [Gemmatimonadaceae bacterium]
MAFYTKSTPNLLAISRRAAEGSDSYQPGAIVSIVFAAITVESFVNDFVGDVSWSHYAELVPQLIWLRELAAATDRRTPHPANAEDSNHPPRAYRAAM